ncbi:MAG: 50S ribosomal protein L20 [Candidatus Andersenbacteria bacterium]|nr:50S ribosomal protein L20 [bacterium]MDZ4225253.1 50S ribosomal protein L20 [Candidatus Andersenbacteria bacterium]
MSRAPRSIPKRKRHKKWIKRAKGFRGRRHSIFKLAKEAVLKAGQHAYYDRRKKKSNFRSQWQVVINAGVRKHDLSYSRFMHAMKEQNISLDRKVLSQLARQNPDIFDQLVVQVKDKIGAVK